MPANPGYTGSSAYLTFGGVNFSPYLRATDSGEDATLHDASAGNIVARDYLPDRADGDLAMEYVEPAGATGITLWAAIPPAGYGTSPGTLEWGEQGTAAGKPKHTVGAYVLHRSRHVPYDDVAVVTVTFQFTGGRVTDGTWT